MGRLLQNLPQLCSVVTECVSSFCIDFWLQTNLHQTGVLWHLLLFLFHYDFTLEEGGVEKSEGSNQQVITPGENVQAVETAVQLSGGDSSQFRQKTPQACPREAQTWRETLRGSPENHT